MQLLQTESLLKPVFMLTALEKIKFQCFWDASKCCIELGGVLLLRNTVGEGWLEAVLRSIFFLTYISLK